MPQRPVIGIVMQTQPPVGGSDRPALWAMSSRYVEILRSAGAVPWLIPLISHDFETLRAIFDQLDGLFLAGGADVQPGRYGETPLPVCGATDPDRDAVELFLARQAIDEQRPLLAVCRGAQLLNVACGGSLYQDIATQVPAALKHDYLTAQGFTDRTQAAHSITIKSGTRLREILGDVVVPVNSIHHQAVKELGRGLTATAFAPDGIVEAIEGPSGPFLLGVQWHPEELIEQQPAMARLFREFVAAAGSR